MTYSSPIVDQVVPPVGTTLGGDRLEIYGRFFGERKDETISVSIGGQACDQIHRFNSTFLTCTTKDHLSAEGTYPILVTVTTKAKADMRDSMDGSTDTMGPALEEMMATTDVNRVNVTSFEYDGPTVAGIQPPYGTPFGGDVINISGTGFGTQDESNKLIAFVGGKPCSLTTWLSESTVECVTPPGFGVAVDVTVSVAGQVFDVPEKFQYLRPKVDSSYPQFAPAWKATRISIRGPSVIPSDFESTKATSLTVTIGPSLCVDVKIFRDYEDFSKNVLRYSKLFFFIFFNTKFNSGVIFVQFFLIAVHTSDTLFLFSSFSFFFFIVMES